MHTKIVPGSQAANERDVLSLSLLRGKPLRGVLTNRKVLVVTKPIQVLSPTAISQTNGEAHLKWRNPFRIGGIDNRGQLPAAADGMAPHGEA